MPLLRWMVLSAWLCFPLALFPATPEPEVVRVGVYLNPPLSFPGLNGKAEGFIYRSTAGLDAALRPLQLG